MPKGWGHWGLFVPGGVPDPWPHSCVLGEKLFHQLLEKQAAFFPASSRPLQGLGHHTGVSLCLG